MRLNKIIILNKNNFYFLIEFFKKKQIVLSNVLLRIQFWIFNNTTLLQKIGEMQFYFAKDPNKKKTWEQWLLDADNSWILGVALIAYYAYPEIKEWWYGPKEIESTTTKQDVIVSKEVTSPQKQLDHVVVENSIRKDTPWCDFMEYLFL